MEGLIHTLILQHSTLWRLDLFRSGVTYSVDATIYDKPLSGANPDPTACTNNTSSITVLVEATPAVVIDITGATNETFCSGDNVVFTVTNPPAADVTNYHFILNGITTIQMVPLQQPVDQLTMGTP